MCKAQQRHCSELEQLRVTRQVTHADISTHCYRRQRARPVLTSNASQHAAATSQQSRAQVLDMLPVADSVTKLTSRCAFCDRRALFSLRTAADQAAQEMVGGSDLYRPVCRRHYVQHSAVSSPAEAISAEV